MISTEDVYEALGISENEALDFMNKYTFGDNTLSGGPVSVVRFAACFAFEHCNKIAADRDNLNASNAELLAMVKDLLHCLDTEADEYFVEGMSAPSQFYPRVRQQARELIERAEGEK